jgi:hypothetical protein
LNRSTLVPVEPFGNLKLLSLGYEKSNGGYILLKVGPFGNLKLLSLGCEKKQSHFHITTYSRKFETVFSEL